MTALFIFPFAAALITLPYMIYHYRRYGGIPFLKIIVFFSFVLYMICAFSLTVLPLPSREAVSAMTGPYIQYIPFSTYSDAFSAAGLSLTEPSSLLVWANWKALYLSRGWFEILANVLMQVPLGVYLRYYFRCGWGKTLLIGFSVSLFYELVQLSGLFFIYSRPYRLASVDDLFDNTLGTAVGYWIAPLLCSVLPSRDALDDMAFMKGKRITLTRRITAAVLDWFPFALILCLFLVWFHENLSELLLCSLLGYLFWLFLIFVVVQNAFQGKSPGKSLVRLRVADADTLSPPSFSQLLIRYSMLYLLLPLVLLLLAFPFLLMVLSVFSESEMLRLVGIAGSFSMVVLFIFGVRQIYQKYKAFPHSYISRTKIVLCSKKPEQ